MEDLVTDLKVNKTSKHHGKYLICQGDGRKSEICLGNSFIKAGKIFHTNFG